MSATYCNGTFDGVIGHIAEGWATDGAPGDPACVMVHVDDELIGECVANLYRDDLAQADIQDGHAHFRCKLPLGLFDGETHVISVRNRKTNQDLCGSPRSFSIAPATVPIFVERAEWADKSLSLHKSPRLPGIGAQVAAKRRVAVLSTYHMLPSFLGYHRHLVAELEVAGFVVLIVHATEEIDRRLFGIETDHAVLTIKKNIGYDFGSWAYGCFQLREHWQHIQELLFINDSNIGPFTSFVPLLEKIRALGKDVVGLTDSYERDIYHLQSYFLWFGPAACQSAALPVFTAQYPFVSSKQAAIENGELAITGFLLDLGLTIGAVYPYERIASNWFARSADLHRDVLRQCEELGTTAFGHESAAIRRVTETFDQIRHSVRNGIPLNPTHFFWDTLIEDFGFPFIKRELVLHNPVNVPSYSRMPQVLASLPDRVADHLMEIRRRYGGRLVPLLGTPAPAPAPVLAPALAPVLAPVLAPILAPILASVPAVSTRRARA